VADWRPKQAFARKHKKQDGAPPPNLDLIENPDILATLARHTPRPAVVIGFALEHTFTDAEGKRERKGCDWLVVNETATAFGQNERSLQIVRQNERTLSLPAATKSVQAQRIVAEIVQTFAQS
jgi:phosphopantothenoylcysteine decarboxylase / phosphopantothenate---cysteine ligase